jgi:hypothetical protein
VSQPRHHHVGDHALGSLRSKIMSSLCVVITLMSMIKVTFWLTVLIMLPTLITIYKAVDLRVCVTGS